ncbi:MAG: GWxTD domain-containing protein [Vicinamibacteria bacterium]|jgi:GWxTD domain-containing protein|nr:GWxTD domain-containing protein [Vicinamibacteria bacterium]
MKRFGLASTLVVVLASPALADLDKNAKKWVDSVRPIILPEEEKSYKNLKNNSDAAEFQKIFWARRDPNLDTPENEFQTEYLKLVAEVDAKYRVGGRIGSLTDCGRLHILMGAPDSVKKESSGDVAFRTPETWTFKDRPGLTFTGGVLEIPVDGSCMLPQGNRLSDQLNRIAELKVIQTNLSYKYDAKGSLVKLADLLPKPTPAQALLKDPRTDFPLEARQVMEIRSQDGASVFVAGLIQGDATGLTQSDSGGKKVVKVVVSVHSTDQEGRLLKSQDREVTAEVENNKFVSAFGMPVRPGAHTMKVAAIDAKSGKGAVVNVAVKTQEYAADLTVSPVMVLADIQETTAAVKDDPFFEFTFGSTRFVPRYGNVFKQGESVTLLAAIYGAAKDEAGKISVVGGFQIIKDGKTLAKAPDQPYDVEPATPSAGPVPLGGYAPGKYVAQLRLRDNVAQKDYVKETEFEIIP